MRNGEKVKIGKMELGYGLSCIYMYYICIYIILIVIIKMEMDIYTYICECIRRGGGKMGKEKKRGGGTVGC